tara:strand:- start:712 stop:939 length:228 start_codon:yes stop_codon:yes gene_type:complete
MNSFPLSSKQSTASSSYTLSADAARPPADTALERGLLIDKGKNPPRYKNSLSPPANAPRIQDTKKPPLRAAWLVT